MIQMFTDKRVCKGHCKARNSDEVNFLPDFCKAAHLLEDSRCDYIIQGKNVKITGIKEYAIMGAFTFGKKVSCPYGT